MAAESTYSTLEQIDTFATENGRKEWSALSDDQKTRSNVEATQDIVMAHQQVPVDGVLFEVSDQRLIDANIIQAIYIAQNQGFRDIAGSVKSGASGRFSDGTINLNQPGDRPLEKYAGFLVKQVMLDSLEFGIFTLERDTMENRFVRS